MAKSNECHDQYDEVCRSRFDEISSKLDDLNRKLFVGNGQPSLNVRIDRLEQCKQSTSKAIWVAITAFITAVAGAVWEMFFQKS